MTAVSASRNWHTGKGMARIDRPVVTPHVSVVLLQLSKGELDRAPPARRSFRRVDPVLLADRDVAAIQRTRLVHVAPPCLRRARRDRVERGTRLVAFIAKIDTEVVNVRLAGGDCT